MQDEKKYIVWFEDGEFVEVSAPNALDAMILARKHPDRENKTMMIHSVYWKGMFREVI